MRYYKEDNHGFTLIEVLTIIVVMAVLFGVGAKILCTTMHSWDMITLRKQMLFESRMGMNRMVREIRLADTSRITIFNPTDFQFTNIRNIPIRFYKDGSILKMRDDPLVAGLQIANGLQFTYLDPNGNSATAASQIRRVKIRLNLQRGGQTFAYESETRIRNP